MSDQDQNPYAPPIASHAPEETRRRRLPPGTATQGQRIAGALLIANAALVFIEGALAAGKVDPSGGAPGAGVVPAMIDLGIGVSLVSGSSKTVRWAVLRTVLGFVLWGALQATTGAWFVVALQGLVCTSFLLLLVGDAGRARIAAGASAFGLYGIVSLLGITVLVTGTNPLARAMGTLNAELEPEPARQVTGVRAGYSFTVPNDHWRIRKAEGVKKANPLADRWLTRLDHEAHLLVIVEDVPPGATPSIESYADAIVENAKKTATSFNVVDRHPLAGDPDNGIFLHTTSTLNGTELEYYYAVIVDHEHAYQVVAFAARRGFSLVAPEISEIFDSFKLPPRAP